MLAAQITTKGTAAVGALWCPGQTASGQCDKTLGLGACELCAAHRLHWSHERNLRQNVTASPEAVAKVLQLDRFLYQYDIVTDADYSYFLEELQAESHGNINEYGHEEWASSWILEAFDSSNFLPLAKTISWRLRCRKSELLKQSFTMQVCSLTSLSLGSFSFWQISLAGPSQNIGATISTTLRGTGNSTWLCTKSTFAEQEFFHGMHWSPPLLTLPYKSTTFSVMR